MTDTCFILHPSEYKELVLNLVKVLADDELSVQIREDVQEEATNLIWLSRQAEAKKNGAATC